MGPYRIVKAQGENFFELDLPEHLRASRARNVSHSREQSPPPTGTGHDARADGIRSGAPGDLARARRTGGI